MKNITEKLTKVYNFIKEYQQDNGFSPSVREICANTGVKSTASVYSYINMLRDKGYLNKNANKKRALSFSNNTLKSKTLPIIGCVRAGSPIIAIENIEGYLPLPEEFSSIYEGFALKVQGDSMINAGIMNNDTIIVEKMETANNGDIVVALIDDEATVKTFYKKDNKIILHPENDNLDDMLFDNVVILGVVKGLIRKL